MKAKTSLVILALLGLSMVKTDAQTKNGGDNSLVDIDEMSLLDMNVLLEKHKHKHTQKKSKSHKAAKSDEEKSEHESDVEHEAETVKQLS